LQTIILHSEVCPPEYTEKFCKSSPDYRVSKRTLQKEERNKQVGLTATVSLNPLLNKALMEGVQKNLAFSSKLRILKLIDLHMSDESWILLAQEGLAKNSQLKELYLNQIKFNFVILEKLSEAVTKCYCLQRIDLSSNDLKDSYGPLVAKFIQA